MRLPSADGLARLTRRLLGREAARRPLGRTPADGVALGESEALRHLALAIDGGEALRVADLFGRALTMVQAPDPSDWLRAMHAGNPPPAPGAVPLRVLTWNLALLDVWLGPRPYQQSPFVEERRERVIERAVQDGADLLLLQEVWHARDQAILRRAAARAGYRLACPPRRHNDGLAILVKEELVRGPWRVELRPYTVQNRQEALAFPGKEPFLRSFLCVRFQHPTLGRLALFDSHLAPYPARWRDRLDQSRELGLAVAALPPEELVLLGGDLNAGPFYGRQSWRRPDGLIDGEWWHDAMSLPLLHHYGGLQDLAIRGRPADEVDLEVRLGRRVDNDPVQALRGPLGCSPEHARAFTATDCNRLYFLQYAGTEQPARLDHLLARDPTGRVHVVCSRHRFLERDMHLGGEDVEPSDHYGVEVEVRVAPP